MDLSVLSLLARLGLDPWAEATRLASLSTVAAAESLAGLIVGLPVGCQSAAQARATAFGLVRLLPGQAMLPRQGPMPPGHSAQRRVAVMMAYGCTVGAALMFGVLLAATLQAPSHADPAGSTTASTLHQPGQVQ